MEIAAGRKNISEAAIIINIAKGGKKLWRPCRIVFFRSEF